MSDAAMSAPRRASPRGLGILLAAAIFLNYADRGMVGVAGPLIKTEMHLSATAFGIAVSAFFWVYAPAQLLVGWLVDRFRVYRLFGGGVGVWGLATALTGLVSGFAPLLALRLALGIGESFAFPGSSKIIARDLPVARRGLANAGISAAVALGPALGTLVGGAIMARYGWRPMFAVFGLGTLIWLLPWWRLTAGARDEPNPGAAAAVPQALILRQPALWVIGACHFTNNYGLYFLQTWLPLYLVKSRGFTITEMAGIASFTFAAQAVGALLAGTLGDRAIAAGRPEAVVRKVIMVAGSLAAAAGIAAVVTATGRPATIGWLIVTGFFVGISTSGLFLISQVFAGPRAAGRWVGIQNFLGNLAGITGPIITGALIDWTGSYTAPFLLAAGIVALGGLGWWLLLPRIAPVTWPDTALA